jgi:predicted transcriptional regulator
MVRSKEAILRDMLAAATEKVNKTTMMYRANLSYPQLMQHLTYLVEKQLLLKQDGLYAASEKGRAYVNAYQRMSEIIAK